MTEQAQLGIAVAFLAGLLSFLSPCVLPLVPSYIGFLTGVSAPDELAAKRRTALAHAAMFVIGFSLIFILLGLGATALGVVLRTYKIWLARVGGVMILVFGLWCLGLIRLDFLEREQRVQMEHKPVGYLGSALVGLAFGAGWTPCIGPILGGILGLAATEADMGRGALLLGAYSAGLAIPFLLAAVAVDRFLAAFMRFRRHMPLVKKLSGVLLIVIGLLLLTGEFTRLAGWLQGFTPDFLRERL